MNLGIRNKIALVAGSSRGLGKSVAFALAEEGVNLLLCSRSKKCLYATQQEITHSFPVKVVAVPTDLSNKEEIQHLFHVGRETFNQIDILVTNSGGPDAGPFETHTIDDWRKAIQLNLESTIELSRHVLPGMKKQQWGRIINITSIAVKQPFENLILSNSVRAAVTGFAKTLANEVASQGITVNNVLPGYTETDRLFGLAEQKAAAQKISRNNILEQWKTEVPMKRFGKPSEFAALVAFLSSEPASYITGTSIPVDGGWVKSLL